MKRTVQIAGGIEPLFGTLDENLKLLESSLRVTTQLHDDHLSIEGEAQQVERAVNILDEYNQLIREGRRMNHSEVKSLIRMATARYVLPVPPGPTAKTMSCVSMDSM